MILLTHNPGLAIDTAFEADSLGYRFENNDGVWVSRLETGKIYDARTYRIVGKPDGEYPLVFSRRKYNGHWEDEWYDHNVRSEYELARMMVGNNSSI